MAYNTEFGERLESLVGREFAAISFLQQTKMFGGMGFMLDNKMCMHIFGQHFVLRVGVENAEEMLTHDNLNVEDMIHRGKKMVGWVTIDTACDIDDEQLLNYCTKAIDFVLNLPVKPKKSKKKKK